MSNFDIADGLKKEGRRQAMRTVTSKTATDRQHVLDSLRNQIFDLVQTAFDEGYSEGLCAGIDKGKEQMLYNLALDAQTKKEVVQCS